MLPQAFWTTLRILVFRAGPEDMPYDTGNRLGAPFIAFAVLVNARWRPWRERWRC